MPIKIRSYYDLQEIRSELEAGLANIDAELVLSDIDESERFAAMVKPLYAVLDDPYRKPRDVRATTLSKILHRKRPHSVILHDKWVNSCYVGSDAPVPLARSRSWADYMTAVTCAIAHDIRNQQPAFDLLDRATGKPGCLTYVRLLDIVAWTSKGKPASEAV